MKVEKKSFLYPVFLLASRCSKDSFWTQIFEELSYGICPAGTFIDGGAFCCRMHGKHFNFQFEGKSAEEIFIGVQECMRDKLGIVSNFEHYREMMTLSRMLEEHNCSDWASIKKKTIRTMMIEDFIIALKKSWGLTLRQTHHVMRVIMTGFAFKLFGKLDVAINEEEWKITRIGTIAAATRGPVALVIPATTAIQFARCRKVIPTLSSLCSKKSVAA